MLDVRRPHLVATTLLFLTCAPPLIAQPANDLCANALPLPLGSTAFDNIGATSGTGASPSCDVVSTSDVWFTFTAPADATYAIDSFGSSFDAVLTVYDAGCVPGVLDEIACNAAFGGGNPQARVFFLATAGSSYTVRVSGQTFGALPSTGTGTLNVAEIPVPANDDCTSPEPLAVGQTIAFDTSAATSSTNFTCPMGPDLWYSVTAPASGVLIVDKSILVHHAIYLLAGPGLCPQSAVEEQVCEFQEHSSFPVVAGETFLLRLAPNFFETDAAIGTLTLGFATTAPNDDCSNPEPFTLGSTIAIDAIAGTLDPQIEITCNPPPFGDNLLYADLWYSLTVPFDGNLVVDLSVDPQATPYHVIYAASGCPTINDELQCSQPSQSSTAVTAGQSILVRVGTSFGGQFYAGDLSIDVIATTSGDDCTAPLALPLGVPTALDTNLASISNGYSCNLEGDVWYSLVAPADGFLSIDLDLNAIGSHALYHLPAGIGTCPADTDQVNCTEFFDLSTTAVIAGEAYLVRISGTQFQGPVTGTILAEFVGSVANDDCAAPTVVTAPGPVPFTTIPGTPTAGLSGCFGFPLEKDVWFSVTPPVTGTLILDFDIDVVHVLYTAPAGGGCPSDADFILCQDAPDFSNTPVVAGQEIRIRVGHYAGSPGAAGTMTVGFATPPTNDDCSNAALATPPPGITAWDTVGASDDMNGLGGGPGCSFGPTNDVWYRFVAPTSGLVECRILVGGSGWSSFVVYRDLGNPCPTDFDAIACRQGGDVDTFDVVAGEAYYVRVGRGSATSQFATGTFQLQYLLGDPDPVTCDASVPDAITATYGVPVGSDYDLGVEVTVDGSVVATIPETQTSYTHLLPPGSIGVYEIGFRGLSSIFGASGLSTCTAAFGAPANDLCSGAIAATVGDTPFDNSGTSTDSNAPAFSCGNGTSDLWFSFVAPNDAQYRASTCGQTQIDTVLEVFEGSLGCPGLADSPIACNDFSPNCPLQNAEVAWSATAGTEYFIRLGGGTAFNGSTGPGILSIGEECFPITGLACAYSCSSGLLDLSWDPAPHLEYTVTSNPGGVIASGITGSSVQVPAPTTGVLAITVTGTCLAGGSATTFCELSVIDPAASITDVVLDLEQSGGAIASALEIHTLLVAFGASPLLIAPEDFDTDPCVVDLLSEAERIWVATGTFPEETHLSAAEGDLLASLVGSGTHLYLEGADHWGFQHVPSDLDLIDGVSLGNDGDDSLTQIAALDSALPLGDFTTLGSVPYFQDTAMNEGTDRLLLDGANPAVESAAIFENVPDGSVPGETVYTVGVLARLAGAGTMISSSFELGGFGGDRLTLIELYTTAMTTTVIVPRFRRGDCNDDGARNIADAIALLAHLFPNGGSPPPLACEDACDGNDDGGLNIADAITILNSLFGTPATPLPAPIDCGEDPSDDRLGCDDSDACP